MHLSLIRTTVKNLGNEIIKSTEDLSRTLRIQSSYNQGILISSLGKEVNLQYTRVERSIIWGSSEIIL